MSFGSSDDSRFLEVVDLSLDELDLEVDFLSVERLGYDFIILFYNIFIFLVVCFVWFMSLFGCPKKLNKHKFSISF